MKEAALSILMTLLVEAIGAVASYLKRRLMEHIHRSGDGMWENHVEFV